MSHASIEAARNRGKCAGFEGRVKRFYGCYLFGGVFHGVEGLKGLLISVHIGNTVIISIAP